MYLLGYTIDNLSLMALTVATGFVVDDAIVVIEKSSPATRNGRSLSQYRTVSHNPRREIDIHQ